MITRRALVGLLPAIASAGAPRRVWDTGLTSHLGGVSPDGAMLSMVDPASGDLAVRMVATGALRRITANATSGREFAYFSAISPDGARIAYAWFNSEGFYELRLASVTTGVVRTLHKNAERRFVQPCAWTPDGKHILTLFFREDNVSQIALVDTADGQVRVLKSLDWVYPNRMDVSPDGKWIAYDDVLEEGKPARGIFLLAVDGSRRRPLLSKPRHDVFPLFNSDGRAVLFLREAPGGASLWRQTLDGSEPQLLEQGMGRALALGITRAGDYFYAQRIGEPAVFLTKPGAETIELGKGVGTPVWSPDGKRLAYRTRAANENFGLDAHGVMIFDIDQRKAVPLMPKLATITNLRWSPDGSQLLAGGSDRHGQRGLYAVDATTGAARPVVRERAGSYEGYEGVWLDSGICYLRPESTAWLLAAQNSAGEERVLHRMDNKARLLTLDSKRRRVAFVTAGPAAETVWTLDVAAAAPPRLAATIRGGGLTGLEWAANGEYLLATVPTEPPSLWRVYPDGRKPVRTDWDWKPAGGVSTHPGGEWLVYTSGQTKSEIWMLPGVGK